MSIVKPSLPRSIAPNFHLGSIVIDGDNIYMAAFAASCVYLATRMSALAASIRAAQSSRFKIWLEVLSISVVANCRTWRFDPNDDVFNLFKNRMDFLPFQAAGFERGKVMY